MGTIVPGIGRMSSTEEGRAWVELPVARTPARRRRCVSASALLQALVRQDGIPRLQFVRHCIDKCIERLGGRCRETGRPIDPAWFDTSQHRGGWVGAQQAAAGKQFAQAMRSDSLCSDYSDDVIYLWDEAIGQTLHAACGNQRLANLTTRR